MLNSYSEDSSFLSSLTKLLSCYRSNFKTLMPMSEKRFRTKQEKSFAQSYKKMKKNVV